MLYDVHDTAKPKTKENPPIPSIGERQRKPDVYPVSITEASAALGYSRQYISMVLRGLFVAPHVIERYVELCHSRGLKTPNYPVPSDPNP